MIKQIVKGFFLVSAALSFLYGVLIGFHLMFYPNVGFPESVAWKYMLFYFSHGIMAQYFALHFFNNQDQEESN